MLIGFIIERLRQEIGFSRAQLADACGLTRNAIYKIESGQRYPTERTVLLIARALRTTTNVLYNSIVIPYDEYLALKSTSCVSS